MISSSDVLISRPAGILYGNGPAEPLYIFQSGIFLPFVRISSGAPEIFRDRMLRRYVPLPGNVLPFWPDLVQSTHNSKERLYEPPKNLCPGVHLREHCRSTAIFPQDAMHRPKGLAPHFGSVRTIPSVESSSEVSIPPDHHFAKSSL